jgi:hypothetical protein
MEELNMVEKKRQATGNQELFTITKKGVTNLTEWVTQPVTMEDVIRNSEILLLRYAFMDVLVKKNEKQKFLRSFLESVKKYIKELESYHASEALLMSLSGRQAFELGLESNRLTARWIEKLLANL